MALVIATTILVLLIMVTVALFRVKSSHQPTSRKKIILPPLFMSTGALMFVFPYFHVSIIQAIKALAVGIIFSLLLIYTSKLERINNEIYLKPSKAFIFILFGLIIFRTIAKFFIGSKVTIGETGGIFFLVGFGMIFTWRIVMLIQYIRLENKIKGCTNSLK